MLVSIGRKIYHILTIYNIQRSMVQRFRVCFKSEPIALLVLNEKWAQIE